jgi:hypothetical protein
MDGWMDEMEASIVHQVKVLFSTPPKKNKRLWIPSWSWLGLTHGKIGM